MKYDYDIFKPSEMYSEYEEEFERLKEVTDKGKNEDGKKQKKTIDKMKQCVIFFLMKCKNFRPSK